MFGLFKKEIDWRTVASDFIWGLDISLFYELTERFSGLDQAGNDREVSAFVYILGWFAIQKSTLDHTAKQLFSTELTHTWAKRSDPNGTPIHNIRFLQSRIVSYRQALKEDSIFKWHRALVSQLLHLLKSNEAPDSPRLCLVNDAVINSVSDARDELVKAQKKYKFNYFSTDELDEL